MKMESIENFKIGDKIVIFYGSDRFYSKVKSIFGEHIFPDIVPKYIDSESFNFKSCRRIE